MRLSAGELDQCARVFGLRIEDFLAGEAGSAPMSLLLRTSDDDFDIRGVLTAEIDVALGEFQRVVRDIHEAEVALGEVAPRLPTFSPTPTPAGIHEGDHRASLVRSALGLGDTHIPSMVELVRNLGIAVIWVTSEQVDTSVDGACTSWPRPGILVNLLVEGAARPWRARITLAHELGHLLFDTSRPDRQLLVSPGGRPQSNGLAQMEEVARAFAACLLAPTTGVRSVVNGLDPVSEEAIAKVGATFGVGRTVAVNRLQHVFQLSSSQRAEMELRAGQIYPGEFSGDAPPLPVGFRGQPLLGLLRRAVESGKMLPGRARRMLLLDASAPLPFGDLGALARPPLSNEALIMRRANEYLAERHPGLVALEPERDPAGIWNVPVAPGFIGKPTGLRGMLTMTDSGNLVADVVRPVA